MVIYLPGWFIIAYGGNQDLQLSNGSLLRIHDEEDFSTIHYFSVQACVYELYGSLTFDKFVFGIWYYWWHYIISMIETINVSTHN